MRWTDQWTAAASKLIILKRNILAPLHDYLELLNYSWVTPVDVGEILLSNMACALCFPQMFNWKHWGILDRYNTYVPFLFPGWVGISYVADS